jgi:hypothetical protein
MEQIEITGNNQAEEKALPQITTADIYKDIIGLKTVLEKETAALKNYHLEEVRNLNDDKVRLVRRLELIQEIMSKKPELIHYSKGIDKEDIARVQAEMQEKMRENFRETMKAQEVNRLVVEAITRAVRIQERGFSYSPYGGDARGVMGTSYRNGSAVTFDQVI